MFMLFLFFVAFISWVFYLAQSATNDYFSVILYNNNIVDKHAFKWLVLVNLSSVKENFSDQMKNLLLLFITLILQVFQAIARATFYHINALSDIC